MPRRPLSRAQRTSFTASSTPQNGVTEASPKRRSGHCRDELRHPAVVGARARPLQLRHHADRLQPEVAAEGRRVRFGKAVDEQDLRRHAVGVQDLVPAFAVPGAGKPVALALGPADGLLAHLEHLAGLLERRHARRVLHVELGAVLRVEVIAVDLGTRPGVPVGRNHEVAVHVPAPSLSGVRVYQVSPRIAATVGPMRSAIACMASGSKP